MLSNVKVSIITVAYNAESSIRDAIESVVSQRYKNIEYIIIDGNSSDQTLSIIREYSDKIQSVVSEPDNGIYDAMNKGIVAATGDIIGILNADDFYANSRVISDVVSEFQNNLDLDVIIGKMVYVDFSDKDKVVRSYNSERFCPWKLRFGWMPPHLATFIKKSVYDDVGLYSQEYKIAADYEMFVRIFLIRHVNYTKIDKILVKMRLGGISTSGIRSNLIIGAEMVKACKSNGVYTNIFFVMSRLPLKAMELIRKPRKLIN